MTKIINRFSGTEKMEEMGRLEVVVRETQKSLIS